MELPIAFLPSDRREVGHRPAVWGVILFLTLLRMGLMTIAIVRERLKTLRRTKLYDLFAAAPLIAWYGFCAAQMLPSVAQRIELVKLFFQTDPSVLPAELVLSTVAHVTTLAFLGILVVMFAVRQFRSGLRRGSIHAVPLWPVPFSASV